MGLQLMIYVLIIMIIGVVEYREVKRKQHEAILKAREERELQRKRNLIQKRANFRAFQDLINSTQPNEQLVQEILEDTVVSPKVEFNEGVARMIRNKPAYRPYHTHHNYTADIRNSLREFTVGEVISTFY